MALTQSGLSAAIKSSIIAKKGAPDDDAGLQGFADALASAIVSYVVANADVLPGSFQSPAGTSGGPISGTGKIS